MDLGQRSPAAVIRWAGGQSTQDLGVTRPSDDIQRPCYGTAFGPQGYSGAATAMKRRAQRLNPRRRSCRGRPACSNRNARLDAVERRRPKRRLAVPNGDGYPLYAGEDGVGIAGNLDGSGHRAVSITLVVETARMPSLGYPPSASLPAKLSLLAPFPSDVGRSTADRSDERSPERCARWID